MVNNSSPLLINESPLQVLPSLAVALGNVNEAIILQQIQYWLKNPKSGRIDKNGRKYIRDTYEEWHTQIPWLSVRSIKERFKSLKNKGIVITSNLNKSRFDRTQWYSIDYDKLNELMQKDDEVSSSSESEVSSSSESEVSLPTIPKTSTKTSITKTSTNKVNSSSKDERVPYSKIIGYLNEKTGQKLKPTTKAYQKLIRARWNDGYKLQDFKTVIDNKYFEWQGTRFWQYMTPKTLFAQSHFDEYLNANKRETNSNHGGFNIDEDAQKKFFDQIDSDDLPF